jgi:integrase
MKKLTNDTVRTLPAKASGDATYPDADPRNGVPGLYLRVRKGGSRTFVIQWRQGEFQRRSTIGKVGVLTLDEARKKARKLLVGIDEGSDPVVTKAKARAGDKLVFGSLAQEYLDARAKDMKALSLDQCTRHLKIYWKPLDRLPVAKIDRTTVAAELRTMAKQRGPVAADRGRSTLSAFFAWCIGEGFAETNPVVGTNKASKGDGRDRVLTDAELIKVWKAAPDGDYGNIVKLLLLTGQRRDEIAALRWSEIDSEARLIALPKERTKNSRPHDVPLSAPATAILDAIPERDDRDLVFGRGEGGFSGYSRAKEAIDKEAGLADEWTLHDLRRTMATRMADLGIQPHVIEATLNHVSGHKSGVAGIYNRSTYAAEKRAALDLWGAHIQTLLARAEGSNVTLLRPSA